MTDDDRSFRIPFTLPIWGVAEEAHLHIDNHINFVLHMDQGWIIGATAYPGRCDGRGRPGVAETVGRGRGERGGGRRVRVVMTCLTTGWPREACVASGLS